MVECARASYQPHEEELAFSEEPRLRNGAPNNQNSIENNNIIILLILIILLIFATTIVANQHKTNIHISKEEQGFSYIKHVPGPQQYVKQWHVGSVLTFWAAVSHTFGVQVRRHLRRVSNLALLLSIY